MHGSRPGRGSCCGGELVNHHHHRCYLCCDEDHHWCPLVHIIMCQFKKIHRGIFYESHCRFLPLVCHNMARIFTTFTKNRERRDHWQPTPTTMTNWRPSCPPERDGLHKRKKRDAALVESLEMGAVGDWQELHLVDHLIRSKVVLSDVLSCHDEAIERRTFDQ